jgi:aquaporin Z
MQTRKLVAEFVGTFFLVFFAVGVATLSFGFKFFGTSTSAGVVATALCFGLVLLALAYTLGAISGCHINPAVTMGFLASGRMALTEALEFWAAQFLGGIAGALVLWGIFSASPIYSRQRQGLGADGFGPLSMIRINAVGAFFTEVILTLLFVYIVLAATSKLMASPALAGLAIGLGLTVVHLIGIPITGTSVNPARSLGPALIVGGQALSQVWLFIVAPLVGGAIAALLYRYFGAEEPVDQTAAASAVQ